MATLAPSFFIGSFSFLLVTGSTIKSRMISILDQIRRFSLELFAIESLLLLAFECQKFLVLNEAIAFNSYHLKPHFLTS